MGIIAVLLPDLRGGGVERLSITLAREFIAAGHTVEFALKRVAGELLPEIPGGATVHDLNAQRVRELPLALTRYFRSTDADAVLAAMWPLTGITCLARRMSGRRIPLVVSEHTDFRVTPSFKLAERMILRSVGSRIYGQADALVAVSSGVADSIAATTGMARERIRVIHNAVEPPSTDAPRTDDLSVMDWWGEARHRLIAIGNLKHQKGFDVLIDAVAELATPDVRLIILGEGRLRGELEAKVRRLGLEGQIRLPGFTRFPATYLEKANLFVLSSRWEGFGNVLIEALSCGVPIVSTDCLSGPAEILENGRYGRLIAVEDASALGAAIDAALASPVDAAQLIRRADDFRPPKAAAAYLNALGLGG